MHPTMKTIIWPPISGIDPTSASSILHQFLFRFFFPFELTGWIYAEQGPVTRFPLSAKKNRSIACRAAFLNRLALKEHFARRIFIAPVKAAPPARTLYQLAAAPFARTEDAGRNGPG